VDPTVRLFVYGTLMRGRANHGLLAGTERLGAARTAAAFELVDLGDFPGLVGGGDRSVAGELYRVDRRTLARLDAFEGHPGTIRRAEVTLADGGRAQAYLVAARLAVDRPRLAARVARDGTPVVRWRGRSTASG
jgi:gamma-glutamylaminecyclotransferase